MNDTPRLYSKQALLGFGLLIGPLAFMCAGIRNARSTTNKKRKLVQYAVSMLPFTAIIIWALLPLPGFGTTSISSSIGVAVIIFIVYKYFSPEIDEHKKNAGSFLNPWPSALAFFLLTLTFIGSVFYFYYRQAHSIVPISAPDFALISSVSQFDINKFDHQMQIFQKNEVDALAAVSSANTSDTLATTKSFRQAETLWSSNSQITEDILAMDHLPSSLKEYTTLLNSYSQYKKYASDAAADNLEDPTDETSYEDYYRYTSRADEVAIEIDILY